MNRREFIGGGIAAILASRRAPAFCVAMRNGMMRPSAPPTPPLPYDAEVVWLEGTGTQYIETGIHPQDNLHIEVRFANTYTVSNSAPFYATSSKGKVLCCLSDSSGHVVLRACSGTATATILADLDWHEYVLDSTSGAKYASMDGTVVDRWSDTVTSISSQTLKLFTVGTHVSGATGRGKLASFSVRDTSTGQLLLDLIPVRKNGVGYMYDRVTGTLLGNQGTGDFGYGPDVPFDDEVEYVQRDYSISWMKDGKPAVNASTQGFNMDKYVTDGETLANMTRRLSARYCAYPVSLANRWAVTIYNNLISAIGIGQSNNSYPYGGRVGALGTFSDSNIPTSVTPDNFHVVDVIPDGVGNYTCSVDGQIITTINNSGTAAFTYFFVLTHFTTANVTQPIMRVSNVRLGSDVYLIPVKKGSQVGFYNMVDGHLFLEEQACLSAGPVV